MGTLDRQMALCYTISMDRAAEVKEKINRELGAGTCIIREVDGYYHFLLDYAKLRNGEAECDEQLYSL